MLRQLVGLPRQPRLDKPSPAPPPRLQYSADDQLESQLPLYRKLMEQAPKLRILIYTGGRAGRSVSAAVRDVTAGRPGAFAGLPKVVLQSGQRRARGNLRSRQQELGRSGLQLYCTPGAWFKSQRRSSALEHSSPVLTNPPPAPPPPSPHAGDADGMVPLTGTRKVCGSCWCWC